MDPSSAPGSYALPSPETIRQTAVDILGRPEYDLEHTGPDLSRFYEFIGRIIRGLLGPIGKVFSALYEVSPVLYWLAMVLLFALLLALLFHITYTIVKVLSRRRLEAVLVEEPLRERLPETWEERARAAFANNDFISAVRFLFRACLIRIEAARERVPRLGATNREYLRRFRDTPAFAPMKVFVEVIDQKWYSGGDCVAEDFERCTEAHGELCRIAKGMAHADGP